jgi:hypothetical protein
VAQGIGTAEQIPVSRRVDVLIEHGDANSLGADAGMSGLRSDERPGNFLRTDDEKKS